MTSAYTFDESVRRFGERGRIILGGSPLRLFRMTTAGAALVDSVTTESVTWSSGTQTAMSLVDRLVDAGVLHPRPSTRRDDPPGAPGVVDVTVVIPVRDRSDGLARLLKSLAAMVPKSPRVIVVDDGSIDAESTKTVVDDFSSELKVELVRRPMSGGPGAARNSGTAFVDTPLVAFLDSDCVVTADWLDGLLGCLVDESTALVAPRVAPVAPDNSKSGSALAGYEGSHSPLDMGSTPARVAPLTRVSYVPSAAMVMRVETFRSLDGFSAALRVGEDVDLVWRAVSSGLRVRYVPTSLVHHESRTNLAAWLRQRFSYGTSAAVLEHRHPGHVAPVAISPYSAAIWGLAVLGKPVIAMGVTGFTVLSLRSKLADLPVSEVMRIGVGGHLGAGAQIARATLRTWWPASLVAAILSKRARRVVAAAAALAVVEGVRDSRPPGSERATDPSWVGRFAEVGSSLALGRLDDLAYGAGVWAGCWRLRSFRALLPSFGSHGDAA